MCGPPASLKNNRNVGIIESMEVNHWFDQWDEKSLGHWWSRVTPTVASNQSRSYSCQNYTKVFLIRNGIANITFHVVFVPKYRRKVIYGEIRKFLGVIFHELARQKESRIIEGHLVKDHVHMCIEIPPKYAVASVIGFLKGKSAIAIARQFSGKQRNYTGENFWARGYAVSTVGFELEAVKKYIREQETSDQDGQF